MGEAQECVSRAEAITDLLAGYAEAEAETELTTLTWRQVDWERLELAVTAIRAKNRRTRRILKSQITLGVLAGWATKGTAEEERLFGYQAWDNMFHRTRMRGALRDVTPRALSSTVSMSMGVTPGVGQRCSAARGSSRTAGAGVDVASWPSPQP